MRVLRWAAQFWLGILLLATLLFVLALALRLLLPLFSPIPTLIGSAPSNGAVDVPPRARLTLRFSAPMNPRSVERALRIAPPIEAAFNWDRERTTLAIVPSADLHPETTYHLTLGAEAHSWLFRPLARPVELRFRTAPAPAVVSVLPADGARDVTLTTPISIRFSRPIVPPDMVAQPAAFPELRFDPPLPGSAIWIDQSTALFRPLVPLRPATCYRAGLSGALADLSGSRLGDSFVWSFSTPAPQILATSPRPGERWVAPRATLAITLSHPLDPPAVRAGLIISPTIEGQLEFEALPDGTQQIRFSPAADWQPGATYQVSLRAAVAAQPDSWSFSAAPRPALIGRFPGEGQALPQGQDIRLVFSSPMDEARLAQALSISPPADALNISVNGTEARIKADLLPATAYSVTLAGSLSDRNGVPLGRSYELHIQTAPAGPVLALPEVSGHVARMLPGQSGGLLVRRTALSALTLDLYRLDETTLVRAFAFDEDEWSAFQPERYAQPLLRSWSVALADPPGSPAESRLLLEDDQGPLSPGSYYLRIRAPEGPRADLLLLVSRAHLALQVVEQSVMIWATDLISGTPLAGVPLTLYQDGAALRRGTTDADGRLQVDRVDPGRLAVALAGGDQPALAATTGTARPERYRAFLVTDRGAYRPGERVEFAGFARRVGGRRYALPPEQSQVTIAVQHASSTGRVYYETLDVGRRGRISAAFTLAQDAPPGQYIVTAVIDGTTFYTRFLVEADHAEPLRVTVDRPSTTSAGVTTPVTITVLTPQGLPVAGAAISWTLSPEPAPFPELDGSILGDDERAPDLPGAQSGNGQAGPDGRLNVVIAPAAAETPLRYRLIVEAKEQDGLSSIVEERFLTTPSETYVGIRLPSRIVAATQPISIEVATLRPDRTPHGHTTVGIEVYRRGATVGQPGERVAVYTLATDAGGRATLPLTLLGGGEYRVIATVEDAQGRRMASATTLWVAEPGFTAWPEEPGDGPRLIADRAIYHPGETATLLLAAPFGESSALITLGRGGGVTSEVRVIRAGEPITVALSPDDRSDARISVLLAGKHTVPLEAVVSPERPIAASTTLPVVAGQPLSVTLATDRDSYAPGATATISVTTMDAAGRAVPADVILSVAESAAAPRGVLADAFDTPERAVPTLAPTNGPAPHPGRGLYWNAALRTGASGTLTLTVTLPRDPVDLRALAWAASGVDRFGQAESSLVVSRAIVLQLEAPPFVRMDDEVELAATVRNTSAISQEVRVTLASGGVEPVRGAPLTHRVALPPGAAERVAWPALVGNAPGAVVTIAAQGGDSLPQTERVERPLLPSGRAEQSEGALVTGRLNRSFPAPAGARGSWARLEIELAPSPAALAYATARTIEANPARSLLDEACLLLIAAPLDDARPMAQTALERLLEHQNPDGGWGWRPGDRSHPAVGAVAIEALAAASHAGLDIPDDVVTRALAALERALAAPTTGAGMRAHIGYALSLYGRSDAALAQRRAAQEPDPEELAYLLLAHTPTAARDDAAIEQLEALALREGDHVHWAARAGCAGLCGDISATALVALALERARPGDQLVPAAARWLASARTIGGWPGAYASARALAVLTTARPAATAGGRFVVALNGAEIFRSRPGESVTTTHQLVQTLARPNNELTITTSDAALFATYRLTPTDAQTPAFASATPLLREYLDPHSGEQLDLSRLRAGQLVRVRLTLIAPAPYHFVRLEELLPAGVELVDPGALENFEHVIVDGDRLILERATLPPGIYQHSYLARAVISGRYAAPAPEARLASGTLLGIGRPATLQIGRQS